MKKKNANFPALLEAFFTERLMNQKQASPETIASYRDTFRLLLQFTRQRLKKAPSDLALHDIDAPLVGAFLDHLEKKRGNSARTRNVRLAAIHSFFRYVSFEEPGHSALIQRVLAIPSKRYDRAPVDFLTRPEVEALLDAPDRDTWGGRRDHALLMFTVDTGLRVSELIGLSCEDIVLGAGAHVRCRGKGRKQRCTPLTKQAQRTLKAWLRERNAQSSDHLFPNARGGPLSPDGVEYIVSKHVAVAGRKCPSLKRKRVSPHVLRHTTAMDLLQAGADRSLIALWLGHETLETVQMYIDANLALKEQTLAKVTPRNGRAPRFRADDRLLAFLRSL